MTDNDKAIVVYVDDTPRCLEEFSWLIKSWLLWGLESEFDIVAYHNPAASSKMPDHPNLIKKPQIPMHQSNLFWDEYRFVNSFAMFQEREEAKWVKENYTHIMKTDCDVFLTKHLMGRKPVKVLLGLGGYMHWHEDIDKNWAGVTTRKIIQIAKRLGCRYDHINHVGASLFGPTDLVISVVNFQLETTEYLLKNEWLASPGIHLKWYKGVASMYAVQIAVNHLLSRQHVIAYAIDTVCWKSTQINEDVIHIHAWHTEQLFSKHRWFRGEYERLVAAEVPSNAGEYCLWIASNDLDELKKVVNT